MNRIRSPFITLTLSILMLICFYSLALGMGGKPPVVLPEGVLNAEQISPLFSGYTVTATDESKGRETVFYFDQDGKITQIWDGWQKVGHWSVRDDGRLCVDFEKSGRDCGIIVKQGAQYRQYAVKKDGNHSYEMTYTNFQKGNKLTSLSKEPLLPEGTLDKDQVVKLFSGNTVESITASQGRVSHTYYAPDGKLVQMRDGVKRHGMWRVSNSARICLQMEGVEEKCRIIVREGDQIKKYIVKKNGKHQHSVTYRKFTPGKKF